MKKILVLSILLGSMVTFAAEKKVTKRLPTNATELSKEEAYALFSKYEAEVKENSFFAPSAARARKSAESVVNEFCQYGNCTKASLNEAIEEIKKSLEPSVQVVNDKKLAAKSTAEFLKPFRANPYKKAESCQSFTLCEQQGWNRISCESGEQGRSDECSSNIDRIDFEVDYYGQIKNVKVSNFIAN
ncbi:MAG: hypothetical protein V4654_11650 [Bdellovibrionota bacterium]